MDMTEILLITVNYKKNNYLNNYSDQYFFKLEKNQFIFCFIYNNASV